MTACKKSVRLGSILNESDEQEELLQKSYENEWQEDMDGLGIVYYKEISSNY